MKEIDLPGQTAMERSRELMRQLTVAFDIP